jgi:hypothetical protein
MQKPGEHKTVQARSLAYAQEIRCTVLPREEAEGWRGFDPEMPHRRWPFSNLKLMNKRNDHHEQTK